MSTTVTARSFQATEAGSPYNLQYLLRSQSLGGMLVQEIFVDGAPGVWQIHSDNWTNTTVIIPTTLATPYPTETVITSDTLFCFSSPSGASFSISGPGTVVFTRLQDLGSQPNRSPQF